MVAELKINVNSIEVTRLLKNISRKQKAVIQKSLNRVSNMAVLMITKRTQSGKLPDGGRMRAYAKGTVKSRKKRGRQTGFLDLTDTGVIKLGTGDDLQIYHNGAGSFIDAYTNHFQIRNDASEIMAAFNRNSSVDIYHDGGKKFASHSNGLSIKNEAGGSSTSLFINGPEGESAEIQMNADDGDDNADYFRLIHVASDNTWRLQNYAGGGWENNILASGNGPVKLYHNNTETLEVTSVGVTVTGAVTDSKGELRSIQKHAQTE